MTDTGFVVRYRPLKDVEETTGPRRAAFLLFEEFLSWREPKPYNGQQNARFYSWFSKTNRHVFCESRLEVRVLQGLDFDRDVAAVAAQPFELSYFADGKRRRHAPDFKPAFCVIAQGSKEVLLGDDRYRYDPAHYLIATAALPVVGQITEASEERTYSTPPSSARSWSRPVTSRRGAIPP